MNGETRNSSEVVKFITLFERLKTWFDDCPDEIVLTAEIDDSVKNLCRSIFFAAHFLSMKEKRSHKLFAAPVDPKFIAAWRDYEKRYNKNVSRVARLAIMPDLVADEPAQTTSAQEEWEDADYFANEQSAGMIKAISFAKEQAGEDDRWDETQEHNINQILEGCDSWDDLTWGAGFDLRGVLRRRSLVPFVLIPGSVLAKHTNPHSMLKNLHQAHDAFVFGAPYAALALIRSIMEAVLRDDYKAEGKDLVALIRHAKGKLPPDAGEAALHRLRKIANAVLHLDRENHNELPMMDEVRLEKEIVSLLRVLRALIEGAR